MDGPKPVVVRRSLRVSRPPVRYRDEETGWKLPGENQNVSTQYYSNLQNRQETNERNQNINDPLLYIPGNTTPKSSPASPEYHQDHIQDQHHLQSVQLERDYEKTENYNARIFNQHALNKHDSDMERRGEKDQPSSDPTHFKHYPHKFPKHPTQVDIITSGDVWTRAEDVALESIIGNVTAIDWRQVSKKLLRQGHARTEVACEKRSACLARQRSARGRKWSPAEDAVLETACLRGDGWDSVSRQLREHGFERTGGGCKKRRARLRRAWVGKMHGTPCCHSTNTEGICYDSLSSTGDSSISDVCTQAALGELP